MGMTDPRHPPSWFFKAYGAIMLLVVVLAPLVWWNFKRYQHDHYGLGQWQTKLTIGPGGMYGLVFKVIGVGLLSLVCVMVLGAVLAAAVWAVTNFDKHTFAQSPKLAVALGMGVLLLFYFFVLMVPVPYAQSRSQNLVWCNTRCAELRFDSALHFAPLTGLTARNWLLMVITLGLYYPFASVAFYRMRVESVTPQLSGDLDRLQAQAAIAGDASGDAAGDFFGIDIGL
jgi:uncharacterized membrane protein YjgN (DUF898 family)